MGLGAPSLAKDTDGESLVLLFLIPGLLVNILVWKLIRSVCVAITLLLSDSCNKDINSETEGAECYYTLKSSDFKPSNTIVENGSIGLSACYDITCYAVSVDCVKSDTAKLYWLTSSGSLEGASINNVSMRGIAIQSAGGFVTISGLDNNETVSFYDLDGKVLGTAKSIDGNVSFSAKQGTVVVAQIGKEGIKIAVK